MGKGQYFPEGEEIQLNLWVEEVCLSKRIPWIILGLSLRFNFRDFEVIIYVAKNVYFKSKTLFTKHNATNDEKLHIQTCQIRYKSFFYSVT